MCPMARGGGRQSQFEKHYVSGNFPVNLYGLEDTRTECWGHAEAKELKITFVPSGSRQIRILELRGDMVAWPKLVDGTGLPVSMEVATQAAMGAAGVLLGFSTLSSTGSKRCDYCADGCMVYVQDAITGGMRCTRSFDYVVSADGLLDSDNVLVLKLAAWLNTTGVPIHIEGTYGILFQYE